MQSAPTAGVPEWTLGDRLRRARRTAGISQKKMADLLLRDVNTMSNWENDHTRPTPKLVDKWAELTEVPVWWLLGEPPPKGRKRASSTRWQTAPESAVLNISQCAPMEEVAA